jgi:hypothetical protein
VTAVHHAILTSIDAYAPRAIWPRPPKIAARAAAEMAHLGIDDLRRLHDVATATDAARIHLASGTISREEIDAVIRWRVRRARLGTLLWLALWLLGLAATVTAAAKGWYPGSP